MQISKSNRIIATPSAYARKHYLYVQEVGSLESIMPHVSSRTNLNSYLFLTVTTGEGILTYENSTFSLKEGDCALIDCRKSYTHESSAHNPWKLMWVHFNGEQAPDFFAHFNDQVGHVQFHPPYPALFIGCIEALYHNQQKQSPLTELSSHKYITDIITLCFTENESCEEEDNSMIRKLEDIHNYITNNFYKQISLDTLCHDFFISKFYLSREYKKTYGITIGNEITARRISHAKSLLRFSTTPIDEISVSCGFHDASYFIKVFKKVEYLTPLEYRKKW